MPTRIKIATALGVPIEDVSESGQNIPESLRSRQGGQIAPRPTSGGLTSVKVAALEGLAEKFKEIGDTEFYELMGTVSRALDELERKRLSGELKPPWQDEGEEGSGGE